MKGAVPFAVLAVALLAMMAVGEYYVYCSDAFEYTSEAEWKDGRFVYSVSSSGSDAYSVVVMDGAAVPRELCIFVDETYDDNVDEARKVTVLNHFSQRYYAEQIQKQLALRSYTNVSLEESGGFSKHILDTMGDAEGRAVLVVSCSLPSSIYTGNPSDPIIEWAKAGGTVYWVGSEPGRFYTDSTGLKEVPSGQELFLGAECVYIGPSERASQKVDNGFGDALILKNSDIAFAVDVSVLDNALAMGFSRDGHSTVGMVPLGLGEVCVVSGAFSIEQMEDVAQLIASGASCGSSVERTESGKVVRSTCTGEIPAEAGSTLYINIGGTYLKHGAAYHA
ncbi:MAG: hypothetical protein IKP18_01505 [Candidatus Methanomethylophilaceae archaeon]|nr:hypothetical protein [Candidatus Methanomethylophilaceae archaeon]